jgi:VWFA-related protein
VIRASVVLALAGVCAVTDQQPVFRAGTDAVTVDVAVFAGRRPIGGLTAADFALRDQGVPQKVELVTRGRTGLDLTLLVDTSTSVTKRPFGTLYGSYSPSVSVQDWFDESVREVTRVLDPNDLLEVMRFAATSSGAKPGEPLTDVDWQQARSRRGRTALLDAMSIALMRPTIPAIRRVILVVTDGRDSASVIDQRLQLEIADRSGGTLYVVAIGGRTPSETQWLKWLDGYQRLLELLTERTGGRLFTVDPGQDFAAALRDPLEELRSRYTLTYVPENVPRSGWHEIDVTVKGRKYDVRARRGYWGGQ